MLTSALVTPLHILLAAFVSARRAGAIDPIVVLRND